MDIHFLIVWSGKQYWMGTNMMDIPVGQQALFIMADIIRSTHRVAELILSQKQ